MAEQTIICPFCKKEIPLTQAITQKIGADLRKKMEEDLFLYFNIELVDSKDPYIMTKEDIEKKNKIGKNGKIYLKHNDSFYIYEFIRNKA